MEETYGVAEYADKALMTPENLILPVDYHSLFMSSAAARIPLLGSEEFLSGAETEVASAVTKAKIASHPQYPRLLQAYIDCQKVGAPPEIACWLDEIRREKDVCKSDVVSSTCFGDDPELDEFMERYCELLVKYKSELAWPLDEATRFLKKIEMQLSHLCCSPTDGSVPTLSEEGGVSSSEEITYTSGGEELKDRLLRKFGSHIGTLKLEFSKKKKKGKLPKDARLALLQWWNLHYKWPYPTEADKIELAKSTGLDQKQINNWFINQRKRHWKPSENMHFSMMENLTGRFLASSSDE